MDVDVPLFLPIYGQRRLHDLRRIAGREKRENFRIQGQMNFDSGERNKIGLSSIFYTVECVYSQHGHVDCVRVCVCVCAKCSTVKCELIVF